MVAPFHLRCWQEAYADLVPRDFLDQMAGQDRAQRWHDRLMRHADTSILAFIGDALVGLATVGPSGDAAPLPSTELRSLYVARSSQRNGLGSQLLDSALAGEPASLWVFEGNTPARGFYEKKGWRPNGERRTDLAVRIPELRLIRHVPRASSSCLGTG